MKIPTADKIHDRESLAARLAERRMTDPATRVVFTNGCFDLLHIGHVRYLWEARGRGALLVVALNDDDSVRRLKGPSRPILRCEERMKVIAGLECVDYVTSFYEDTPIPLIELFRPEVLIKGGNYAGPHEVVGHDVAAKWNAEVATVVPTQGASTTDLIGRVQALKAAQG